MDESAGGPQPMSSGLTFAIKYVVPLACISFFGLAAWSSGGRIEFLAAWAVTSLLSLFLFLPLKEVSIDESSIFISNFNRSASVPLTHVVAIEENRWINVRPITVTFDVNTPFGRKIMFVPKGMSLAVWKDHPVTRELKLRIEKCKSRDKSLAASAATKGVA